MIDTTQLYYIAAAGDQNYVVGQNTSLSTFDAQLQKKPVQIRKRFASTSKRTVLIASRALRTTNGSIWTAVSWTTAR